MADLSQLRTWLTEAETARHKLLTGSLRQRVSYNGQADVTFAQTDIARLDAYIASLKSQIASADGSGIGSTRPIHFTF
jgi:hypothetical protein